MRKLPKAARAAGRERAAQDHPPHPFVDENASKPFSPAVERLRLNEPGTAVPRRVRGVDKPEGI